MRIFYAFLIILTTAILFMLPVSEAIYDFRTDLKTDSFYSTTDPGITTDNLTLTHEIYDADTSSVSLLSSNSADLPVLSAYDPLTHSVLIAGLDDDSTRTLQISYDIFALAGWTAIDIVVSRFYLIWFLCIFAFLGVSLFAIFRGRA